MAVFTLAYVCAGREWHRLHLDLPLTAQQVADRRAGKPFARPTDEVRVWAGQDTDRAPDGIARHGTVA